MSDLTNARVELLGHYPALEFRSRYGTVVDYDDSTGYWIVELDEPALWSQFGVDHELPRMRVAEDNMVVVTHIATYGS